MTLHGWFNLFEGIFWITLAQVALVKRFGSRRESSIAAIALVLFGLSDFIEIGTGAWYRPTGLLVLKGVCLTTLLVTLVVWKRRQIV